MTCSIDHQVLRRALLVLAMTLLPGFAAATRAQQEEAGDATAPGSPCATAHHREFDFWLGSWEVFDPEGARAGSNGVTEVADGCGLLERWTGARGGTGTSLNYYDPASGTWHQHWVGLGVILHLEGGLEAGRMVLQGRERVSPHGPVVDRIVWAPLDGGDVVQRWEVSADGGTTWKTLFEGTYRRR